MPQLDNLIFFNEMIHLIGGFIIFYILFVRIVIVKLAYILKGREKLFSRNIFQTVGEGVFIKSVTNLKEIYKGLNYVIVRIGSVRNKIKNEVKNFISQLTVI